LPGSLPARRWGHSENVRLDFITKGRTTEDGHVEGFNGKFRGACLNENMLVSLDDGPGKVEAHRVACNEVRPHGSLESRTPDEFARSLTRPASTAAQ
jgi:putative transposase